MGLPLDGKAVSYDQCERAFFYIVDRAAGRPVEELMTVFGTLGGLCSMVLGTRLLVPIGTLMTRWRTE